MPSIEVFDHSGAEHGHDLSALQRLAHRALQRVLPLSTGQGLLDELGEIEITLVDDAAITRLHGDYMGLPDATDVITFQHGEIVISVETAARQAPSYGRTPFEEVILYMIHGLLHLAGYADRSDADFEIMKATQEAVFAEVRDAPDSRPGSAASSRE